MFSRLHRRLPSRLPRRPHSQVTARVSLLLGTGLLAISGCSFLPTDQPSPTDVHVLEWANAWKSRSQLAGRLKGGVNGTCAAYKHTWVWAYRTDQDQDRLAFGRLARRQDAPCNPDAAVAIADMGSGDGVKNSGLVDQIKKAARPQAQSG